MVSILIDPTKRSNQQQRQMAPRRHETLHGLTLGLLGNSKVNADEVLIALGDLLQERYELKGIVHDRKDTFSLPVPEPLADKIAREADVVIAGVGD